MDRCAKVKVDSRRVCAITLCGTTSDDAKLTILNVYIPCDNNTVNDINPEYQQYIDIVELMVARSKPIDDMVLCGDWNTAMERNNAQTNALRNFMLRNDLMLCWDHPVAETNITYCNYELNHHSCIDHFVLTPRIYASIRKCEVATSPLNPSHHRIITLKIKYDIEHQKVEQRNWEAGKIAWHKVEEQHLIRYKQTMVCRY